MKLKTKAELLLNILRWRATWSRYDSGYRPSDLDDPKFITARQAAALIPDGVNVLSSGMAGNARCSIFFWAIRDAFRETGHPRGLFWMTVGAQGGRGRAPGTLEELALPGLITSSLHGHTETHKAILRLADAGHCKLHTLPQGQMTFLIEGQGRGEQSRLSETGLGTFLDPEVGRGSVVVGDPAESLVRREGDRLRYRLPRIDVALFNAPYADREGNIYMHGASTWTESLESARAARANGGQVMVAVSDIIPKDERRIFLEADAVDAIVVNPRNEQTGGVPQRRAWKMLTPESDVDIHDAVARLKFVNNVLGITPRRGAIEDAVSRLAAQLFVAATPRGSFVNIGTGLPEEVGRLVYEAGITDEVTFFTETGTIGGLPAPGIFFGAAANPRENVGSARVFHRAYEELATTILGMLQADSLGNVNLSNRGPGKAIHHVGPGGAPDLVAAARAVVFVGRWMAHAKVVVEGGQVRVEKAGTPKFRANVDEISLSGPEALRRGKQVFFATDVGAFRLTERGMELTQVMPGVDVQRDILAATGMRVVLPEDGVVPVVSRAVVTGEGFRLGAPGDWAGALRR